MDQLVVTEKLLVIGDEDTNALSVTSSFGRRLQMEIANTGVDLSLSRSGSFSRLNASAPEFVPRSSSPVPASGHPRIVKIHHPPTPPPVIHVFHPPQPTPPTVNSQFNQPGPPIGVYDYYGGAIGGGGFGDLDSAQVPVDSDSASPVRDVLPEEVVHKITKQVEYYFSDANLATTEHLMRFISKDPDGSVPINVVASFKKIKALVHNNLLLANALRASSKLAVSDDGKKVRRLQPFTEADVEELQSRIVVAENLPEDHTYQNLIKIFSAFGSVKTIRTCYPQTPNGAAAPTNRSSKLDMLFCNKLHAFVEFKSVEDAERAVAEMSKEGSWRSGLRLRLLNKCIAKHGFERGRKAGNDGDEAAEEEEVYVANQLIEKFPDDASQQAEILSEPLAMNSLCAVLGGEEGEGSGRRGKARGRGRGRGRNRNQHHGSNIHHRSGSSHCPSNNTPTSTHPNPIDQPAASKQPPGPRMPDGTRGFAMGRGKPSVISSTAAAG